MNKLLDGLTATLETSVKKGYKDGLEKAIEIIDKELEFAKVVNSQMAMGMEQVRMLISKEVL